MNFPSPPRDQGYLIARNKIRSLEIVFQLQYLSLNKDIKPNEYAIEKKFQLSDFSNA